MTKSEQLIEKPDFFDPKLAELATFRQRGNIYQNHLRQIRIFLWISLFVFSALFYWIGEKNRYVHIKDNIVLDTKTGAFLNSSYYQIK